MGQRLTNEAKRRTSDGGLRQGSAKPGWTSGSAQSSMEMVQDGVNDLVVNSLGEFHRSRNMVQFPSLLWIIFCT